MLITLGLLRSCSKGSVLYSLSYVKALKQHVQVRNTCEDGLVNSQGGGLDRRHSDVSGHLVAN